MFLLSFTSVLSYISKVDVLKILVSANYKYIPSLDDILETSAVTRLRNQLLEAEHYQLAVEVSQLTLFFYDVFYVYMTRCTKRSTEAVLMGPELRPKSALTELGLTNSAENAPALCCIQEFETRTYCANMRKMPRTLCFHSYTPRGR